MNKMKIFLLIALVAVVIWYFNQEKPVSKPRQQAILPLFRSHILPTSQPSASLCPEPGINFPYALAVPEELDYGWLTDDNLEFILKNHPVIQAALARNKQFHLRTDLANVYHAFYKAKTKQAWDLADFCEELERNRVQYVLFPLRVNGNHWGLVILEKKDEAYQVWYTSSGGGDLEDEKEQIKPWVEQVCGVGTEIRVIVPADRDSKGYDCGVYLVFYIEEILESGRLELKRSYTEQDCQEFRKEWKGRIGDKWCCWD